MASWTEFKESTHYPRYFGDYLYNAFDGDKEAVSEWLWSQLASGDLTNERVLGVMSKYDQHCSVDGLVEFTSRVQRVDDYQPMTAYRVPQWYETISTLVYRLHERGIDMTKAAQRFAPTFEHQVWATLIFEGFVDYEDAPTVAKKALVRSFLAHPLSKAKDFVSGLEMREFARGLATQYGVTVHLEQLGFLGNPDDLTNDEIAAVFADISWQGDVLEFIDLHIRPRGKEMLDLLERDFHEYDGSYVWRATVGIAHALIARDAGVELDLLADSLKLCLECKSLTSKSIRRDVAPVLAAFPTQQLDDWMAPAFTAPERGRPNHRVAATRLFDLLSDAGQREALAFWLPVIADQSYPDEPTRYLSQSGPALVPVLEEFVADASAKELVVIANILGGHGHTDSARLLVRLLGTRTKTPRAAAQKALANFGPAAIEAVREGAKSDKTAIREYCQAQLPRIEETEANADVDFDAESVCDGLRFKKPHGRRFLQEHGADALELLDDVLISTADSYSVWNIVEWLDDPNEDILRTVVDLLCRMQLNQTQKNELNWRLVQNFGAEKAAAVLLDRINTGSAMGLHRNFTQFILEKCPLFSAQLVLNALQSDSKVTRRMAVHACSKHRGVIGEDDDALGVDDVVALLGEGRATTRKAAVAALFKFLDLDLIDHREAIEKALADETNDEVAFELEDLLDAL